jgi:hypothetical protein
MPRPAVSLVKTAARELASERMAHLDDRLSTLLALLMLAA